MHLTKLYNISLLVGNGHGRLTCHLPSQALKTDEDGGGVFFFFLMNKMVVVLCHVWWVQMQYWLQRWWNGASKIVFWVNEWCFKIVTTN